MAKGAILACPTKQGHFLYNVELKYSEGKSLTGQPDHTDDGGRWNFAPPVKGRSPRRLSMSSIYRPVNSTGGSDAREVQDTAVVPQTVRSCIFKVAAAEVRSSAVCLPTPATAPDAITDSNAKSKGGVSLIKWNLAALPSTVPPLTGNELSHFEQRGRGLIDIDCLDLQY